MTSSEAAIEREEDELSGGAGGMGGVAIVLASLAAGILAFYLLSRWVLDHGPLAFDHAVLATLREGGTSGGPWGPWWLEDAALDLTALGSTSFSIVLLVAVGGWLVLRGHRALATWFSLALIGGRLLAYALKASFDRARPDFVHHAEVAMDSAFPSTHAMMAAVVWFSLAVLLIEREPRGRVRWWIAVCASLLTVLVGVTRVYLGVHWPTDVVAGWAAGVSWALACALVLRRAVPAPQRAPIRV